MSYHICENCVHSTSTLNLAIFLIFLNNENSKSRRYFKNLKNVIKYSKLCYAYSWHVNFISKSLENLSIFWGRIQGNYAA